MTPRLDEPDDDDGDLSINARVFGERDISPLALWLGLALLLIVFGGIVASFFVSLDGETSVALAIARMFLRR